MTSSFKKINYSLRPGKHAARRMLREIFGRLGPFQPVHDYVYLGFGSVWFADFILFHRNLGVREMISIERDSGARDRIEASKPFRNISVYYRSASKVLPKLDWNRKYFVWLDYEDALSLEVLGDIRTVTGRATSGTVLAVSLPCQRAKEVKEAQEDDSGPSAIQRFRTRFDRARISSEVSEADLEGWPFGTLSRSIIAADIEARLAVRNGTLAPIDQIRFKPICNIEYNDGTRMTTTVGILAAKRDQQVVKECGFNNLDFLPARRKSLRIEVPKLTVREIRELERQLPRLAGKGVARGPIPFADARSFSSLYRYLPNFAVLEN